MFPYRYVVISTFRNTEVLFYHVIVIIQWSPNPGYSKNIYLYLVTALLESITLLTSYYVD